MIFAPVMFLMSLCLVPLSLIIYAVTPVIFTLAITIVNRMPVDGKHHEFYSFSGKMNIFSTLNLNIQAFESLKFKPRFRNRDRDENLNIEQNRGPHKILGCRNGIAILNTKIEQVTGMEEILGRNRFLLRILG